MGAGQHICWSRYSLWLLFHNFFNYFHVKQDSITTCFKTCGTNSWFFRRVKKVTDYARFDIVSDKCHPAPYYLNSDMLFLTLSDRYRNPKPGFIPGT